MQTLQSDIFRQRLQNYFHLHGVLSYEDIKIRLLDFYFFDLNLIHNGRSFR